MGDPATEHALAVAREAIAVGLVDRETALRLYKDYTGYVERGVKASFTRLLLSRGEIDQAGFSQLEANVPPPAELSEEAVRSGVFTKVEPAPPSAQASSVFRKAFPSDRYKKGEQEEAGAPDLTMDYDAVLSPPMNLGQLAQKGGGPKAATAPPAKAEMPDLTMDYDAVLAPPMAFPGAPAGGMPALAPSSKPQKSSSGDYSPIGLDSTAESSKSEDRSASGLDIAMDPTEAREKAFFSVDDDDSEDSSEGDNKPLKEPDVGGKLDNYKLKKVIGRGGMGVIYLVENVDDRKEYALKALTMVNRTAMGKKRRARFQREVNALRRLDHPNLIKVHTCGRAKTEDGAGPYDYYVMDLVEGKELKALLKADQLRRKEKLEIFADICKAVVHAHERGVIHRDLKPANVLVGDDMHVIVLDFGLAKVSDGVGDLTRTGSALGTPYYMAPEQLLNPKDVDARSDIFALGVMLYEMMTGKRPFTGQTAAEVGTKIMNHIPERPSKVNPNLDVAIDAVILKALAKETEHRYQNVGDLLREISRLIGGRAVKANTTDLQVQNATSWAQTNMIPLAVGFGAATMIWWFFGAVYWLLF